MRRDEFAIYITEDLLGHIGGVYIRPMFSGFGLYREGVMAGLIVEDELYLKVDDTNRKEYEAMGSTPFSYERKDGKVIALSYWKIPLEILEDREQLTHLFELSYDISFSKKSYRNGRNEL